MQTYILLSRISAEALHSPEEFERLNHLAGSKVRAEAPEVNWIGHFTTLGPYDYLDIFEAPDNETAARVALIIRSVGHAQTEVWPAVTWERFREITRRSA